MRSPDFGRVNVAVGVLLQRAIIFSKDKAKKLDAPILGALKLRNILLGIRRPSNNDEGQIGRDFFISLNHEVSIVLGLQSADVEDVAIRLEAVTQQTLR